MVVERSQAERWGSALGLISQPLLPSLSTSMTWTKLGVHSTVFANTLTASLKQLVPCKQSQGTAAIYFHEEEFRVQLCATFNMGEGSKGMEIYSPNKSEDLKPLSSSMGDQKGSLIHRSILQIQV
ncbi:hypothetical protein Nepgr_023429 [Nepenthes gracilis]|uniref:Uncharacterized protein n=1 Tax=Nepenthes gracilis TaxID=150966 RepID=A0AAD3T3S0_NEPGR|nr:hypothetical protein Nepgr_023429 [Nepenthes gracilis]